MQEITEVEVTVSGEDADAQAARELEEKIEDGEVMMFSGTKIPLLQEKRYIWKKERPSTIQVYIGNYLTCWFTVNGKIACTSGIPSFFTAEWRLCSTGA